MLKMHAILVTLFAVGVAHSAGNSTRYGTDQLSLVVNNVDGSFEVLVYNKTWLKSYDFGVHCNGQWLTSKPGPNQLHLKAQQNDKGHNNWGSYVDVNFIWSGTSAAVEWSTVFRFYEDIPIVQFMQVYTTGCRDMAVVQGDTFKNGILEVSSAFPTFEVKSRNLSLPNLNYLTFSGSNLAESKVGHVWDNLFPGGSHGGVPIVFYDDSNHAVILSPMDNFLQSIFVQSAVFDGQLACGLNGKTVEVHSYDSSSQGFNVSYIMMATDKGVRDALRVWGDHIMKLHGKQRRSGDENLALQKLGYATDNGAYYYYNTELGKTYEDILLGIDRYFNESGLPLAYFQLDSWWYPKSNATGDGGCLLWEPMSDVFPHGMKILNKHVWLHARYVSPVSPYNTKYKFLKSDSPAHPVMLPQDSKFYTDIMEHSRDFTPKQGMIVFEQDWMSTPLMRMNITHTDYAAADLWLSALNTGAASYKTWLQLDTAFASEILASVRMDRAVQGSTGNDYQPGNWQWDDGLSDMLFDAVGLTPWKDTFWTTEKQPGCPDRYASCNGCYEPNPELQTLLAILSTGPVSPGDGIGHVNITLLQRTCMSDGTLLKPDKPALPMNKVFTDSFDEVDFPRVLVTESYPEGSQQAKWYYVFAAKLTKPFTVYPSDINSTLTSNQMIVVTLVITKVQNGKKDLMMTTSSSIISIEQFDSDHPLVIPQMMNDSDLSQCGQTVPFMYYMVVPHPINGWFVLGEMDKFVPANRYRILDAYPGPDDNDVFVTIAGPLREYVTISLLPPNSLQVMNIRCHLYPDKSLATPPDFYTIAIYCRGKRCNCTQM